MKTASLSGELLLLRDEFASFEKTGGVLSPEEVTRLRERLRLLARYAATQEHELAVHRLIEAGRAIGREVEKLTAEAQVRLLSETSGNVVSLSDFTGGKKP